MARPLVVRTADTATSSESVIGNLHMAREREVNVFEGPYPQAIVVQRALNIAGVLARVVEFPMPCEFDAPCYIPPYGSILVSLQGAEHARALITDIPSRTP